MRKKYEQQMTVDDHNFLSMGDLFPTDQQLDKMSAALDKNPQIIEAAAGDLRTGLKETGALGMTVEQALRSAIIYQLKCYSYREAADRIADSYNFRKFTRFHGRKVPHFTNFEKAIKKIRPETFEKINDLLVEYAVKKKLEQGKSLRADATVVETNIHYPTDSGLLWDSIRVLDRLMKGARDNCPSVVFEYHDRTRRAKKLAYQITMVKGKGADKKRRRWYRTLLKVAREVLEMAGSCRLELGRDGIDDDEKTFALLFKKEFDNYIPLAERAAGQCQRRVLDGETVPAGEKIVSIFEPHTDVIRRGKTISPAEFGHKALFATGGSGLVLQYQVCEGNPGDGEFMEGMLEKHLVQFGRGPGEFAADRRFYSAENERVAASDPFNVERVSIPKPGKRSPERVALEKQRWFKKLQRFRAGIEGCLSTLLRCFGLDRCLWRGFESFRSWVGLSVFSYNLRKIAALT